MTKITKLNRYEMVGKYSFVGKGLIFDHQLGKTFEAELRFNANTPSIETSEEGVTSTHLTLTREPDSSKWEIIVFDNEE